MVNIPPKFKLTARQEAANKILAGSSTHEMLFGGSRSGKTFLICRNIVLRALLAPESRHGIFRYRYNAVKASIQNDTMPKVFKLCFPAVMYVHNKTEGTFTLPNGSCILLGGLDDGQRVEKLLGLEFATIYINEASEVPLSSRNILVTRLAQKCYKLDGTVLTPRMLYDANPPAKTHWTYKLFIQKIDPESKQPLAHPDDYCSFQINPQDNTENTSEGYLKVLEGMSPRLQKRFLLGEFSDEGLDTLFKESALDRNRIPASEVPEFTRLVLAVDPSGAKSSESKGDAIGIILAGLGTDQHAYILKDLTLKASPNEWGRLVAETFEDYGVDLVVGELNYGGAMVEEVIRTHNPMIAFKGLTSSRGKHIRAEPIATLYEQDRVHHVGDYSTFADLEEELLGFTTSGYSGDRSPNRADALVFAVQELFHGIVASPVVPRQARVESNNILDGFSSMGGRRRVSRGNVGWMR